uniref:Minor histocompatibility antigen H13 n=1 Tax=Steinernema glaseri TaxID=37863 RepID=A0A1I7YYX2_9BILA
MADVVSTTPAPAAEPSANETVKFDEFEQFTAYGSLYGMAILCLIVGGYRSVLFVQRHVTKKKAIETSLSTREAMKFPFTASLVLFGLYCFFNFNKVFAYVADYLPVKIIDIVNRLNSTEVDSPVNVTEVPAHGVKALLKKALIYMPEINKSNVMHFLLLLLCWEGCVALAAILKPFFQFFLRRLPIGDRQPRRNVPYLISFKSGKKEMDEGDIEDAHKDETEYIVKIEFDSHDLICIAVCIWVGVSHLYQRHWITNNLLGIAFSIYGIENLHLSSFKAGTWLLAGLFVYDVFWVFGTEVMTTVAKGIDAPILLQFPLDIYRNGWLDANKYAMLGLGDIVIPGIFVALLRRFDHRIGQKADGKKSQKPRYYFIVTMFAYAFGLFITMGVMHYFKAAQPALLYLVPSCVLIPLIVAAIRGEAHELWNYTEEALTEAHQNKLKEKAAEKKTQ